MANTIKQPKSFSKINENRSSRKVVEIRDFTLKQEIMRLQDKSQKLIEKFETLCKSGVIESLVTELPLKNTYHTQSEVLIGDTEDEQNVEISINHVGFKEYLAHRELISIHRLISRLRDLNQAQINTSFVNVKNWILLQDNFTKLKTKNVIPRKGENIFNSPEFRYEQNYSEVTLERFKAELDDIYNKAKSKISKFSDPGTPNREIANSKSVLNQDLGILHDQKAEAKTQDTNTQKHNSHFETTELETRKYLNLIHKSLSNFNRLSNEATKMFQGLSGSDKLNFQEYINKLYLKHLRKKRGTVIDYFDLNETLKSYQDIRQFIIKSKGNLDGLKRLKPASLENMSKKLDIVNEAVELYSNYLKQVSKSIIEKQDDEAFKNNLNIVNFGTKTAKSKAA